MMAGLGHQRQIRRDRIVVRRRRRDIVGEGLGEVIGRNRIATRHFARLGIDVGRLDRPLLGDRLHFRLIIAQRFQIAEGHELEAVAGRADFFEHLKAALQLLAIITAEGTVEREGHMLGRLVEFMLHGRLGRVRHIGGRAEKEGDQQPTREEEADEKCADANHDIVSP